MLFLLIVMEFQNCWILKTLVHLEITDFGCFLILTLSFFPIIYSQAGIRGIFFFFFERVEEETGIAGFEDCIPPTLKDVYNFIDILPWRKGPGGWRQAENEPTAYSLTTDKTHLILATLCVWPADKAKLLSPLYSVLVRQQLQ